MSDDQLNTLRHMLGINDPSKWAPNPYRNYAAVNPDDPFFADLERLGFVERYRRAGNGSIYDYYRCTPQGILAAIESHRTIRYSKSRCRYVAFLRMRDVCPDLTFREFLVSDDFRDARRDA